jgi:hypothetical protein
VLPGAQTVVTDKSMRNLPTNVDREKESVLPSGSSATPRSSPDRTVPKYESNRPDNDIDERPRTFGLAGEEYGHPSKNDYGMPTRRTMTAWEAGPPTTTRQRKQRPEDRVEDHRRYRMERGSRIQKSKQRYKSFCRHSQTCQKKRQLQREYPQKFKRRGPLSENAEKALTRRHREDKKASLLSFTFLPFGSEGFILHANEDRVVFHMDDVTESLPTPVFSRVAAFDNEASFRRYVDAVVTISDLDAATVHGVGALYGVDTDGMAFDRLTPNQLRVACDILTDAVDGELVVLAYQRQRRSRGAGRTKRHRYYQQHKAQIKTRSRIWRRKNKNNPRHKRNALHRRRFPSQHRRLAQDVQDTAPVVPEIEFSLSPDMRPGSVNSIAPEIGDVTFTLWDKKQPEVRTVPLADFLGDAVFYSDDDLDSFFVMLEAEMGLDVYTDELDEEVGLRLATGDVIMFDRAPPNDDVNKPGEDVAYDVTGPNMTVKTVDEKGGVPAGQGMPDTHTDDVPAASSRVTPNGQGQFVSGEMTYMQASVWFKMAVLMKDIRSKVPPDVLSKARSIRPRLQRVDEKNGIYTFRVPSSEGSPYTVKLRPIRKGPTLDLQKLDVLVSCSCPYFQWQGPEHWAKANGFLYGKPRGTASTPDVKDPKKKHWACKHLISVFDMAEQYGYQLSGKVQG